MAESRASDAGSVSAVHSPGARALSEVSEAPRFGDELYKTGAKDDNGTRLPAIASAAVSKAASKATAGPSLGGARRF